MPNITIKYPINENYFATINTEAKAYWLGFLFADGSLAKKTSNVAVALAIKDQDHVIKLRDTIQPLKPIKINIDKSGCQSAKVTFTCKKLWQDLTTHGCIPNKSLVLKPPTTVPNNLIRHFIRGLHDGDGSLAFHNSSSDNYRVLGFKLSLCSTLEICEWLKKMYAYFGVNSLIDKRHKDSPVNNYNVNVSGRRQIAKILRWLYHDATVYLQRKYERYQLFLSEEEKLKNLKSVNRLFSALQVEAIKKDRITDKLTYIQLAAKYGCCKDTIRKLIKGRQYKEHYTS